MKLNYDPGATQALRRASPFWAKVRETLDLKVAITLLVICLGALVTMIVEFKMLRNDLTGLTIAIQGDKDQKPLGERLATLETRLDDMDAQVQELQRRWDHVDNEVKVPLRKKR